MFCLTTISAKGTFPLPTNSLAIHSVVIVPGAVALPPMFLPFTYLYQQNRQQYFRAWQLAGYFIR